MVFKKVALKMQIVIQRKQSLCSVDLKLFELRIPDQKWGLSWDAEFYKYSNIQRKFVEYFLDKI